MSTDALTYTNRLPAYYYKFPNPRIKLYIPYKCNIYTVNSKDIYWTIIKKASGSFSVN